MSVQIAIAGVSGRMGRTLLEAVAADPACALCAAIDRPGSPLAGQDAGAAWGGASGVRISDQPGVVLPGAQALIDFTRPEATVGYLDACVAAQVPLVIGTTGFDDAGKARIEAAAQRIPIVFAPNMSVGVNLLMKLAELAAQVLQDGYDIEIIEAHHRHKVDAPSGTALGLGQAVARAIDRDLASARSTAARASPASAIPRPSALPPCAAATSSATTRCCSPASANASNSPTRPAAAPPSRRARCAPPNGCKAARRGCTTCAMC